MAVLIVLAHRGLFQQEGKRDGHEQAAPERTYSLRTNGQSYSHDEMGAALIKDLLSGLSADYWDFITITPDEPINDSTFIQVGAPDAVTHFDLTVEVGVKDERPGCTIYKYYTKDRELILRFLLDYFERQETPDISHWEKDLIEIRE